MAGTDRVNFEREVLEASHDQPVLVDFWAPWCAPCRVVGPVLERLAAEAAGRFRLVKLNTEVQPEWAERYAVSSIPALKLFRGGNVVSERLGALPERELRAWLETEAPSPARRALSVAISLRDRGDHRAAFVKAQEGLALAPRDTAARILVSELGLLNGDGIGDTLDDVTDLDPLADHVAAVHALRDVLGRRRDIEQRAADGKAAWKHYARAVAALAAGHVQEALDELIAALELNPQLDEGHAKAAASALLRAVGEASELAQSNRRRLAAAMF